MRVLHVCEVATGGVVSLVRTYASAQAERGHEPHVLAPPGAAIDIGDLHAWQPRRRAPHRYPAMIRTLHDTVQRVKPDVVHLHSFFPGLLGRARSATLAGCAVVYQPHSWAFQAVRAPVAPGAIRAWERRAGRRTHLLVTNCDDELDEGRSAGVVTKAAVVGLPVDTGRFTPADDVERKALRTRLELDTDHVLVCVGRICYQKGQDLLVAAWEENPIPNTTLVLVGGGDSAPLRDSAPRTWGKSVIATGDQPDVRPWLGAANLCVMPSRYEGQSVAMGEALAAGRPVVITEVNGARDAVDWGADVAAGAVVPPGDMTALLEACRRRVADPSLLAAEADQARSRAVQHFSVERVMSRLDASYDEAIRQSRALQGER